MRPLFAKSPPRLVDDWPHLRRAMLREVRAGLVPRLILRRGTEPHARLAQTRAITSNHQGEDGIRVMRFADYKVARNTRLNMILARDGIEAERRARDDLRKREFFGMAVKQLLKNKNGG